MSVDVAFELSAFNGIRSNCPPPKWRQGVPSLTRMHITNQIERRLVRLPNKAIQQVYMAIFRAGQ